MTDNNSARVNYFARQFLGTQDFEAEQRYHLAMQRRHNIALHRWGIVAGLELNLDSDGNLQLLPGMAIDGYGREIILATIEPLSQHWFDEKGSDTLDVLIEYQLRGSDLRSERFSGCDTDDATSFYRWQEQPLIRLAKPDLRSPGRREPRTVPPNDLAFEPFRVPPDDPEYDWPVFLGQISRERQRSGQTYTYSCNHDNRPYAGLIGAQVVAPSDLARLELGARDPDDTSRFRVFVREKPRLTQNESADPSVQDQSKDTLALKIDDTGALDINGATTIQGNLTLDKSAIEFHAGVVGAYMRPWQIYYIDAKQNSMPNQGTAQQPSATPPAINHELRIEVPPGEKNSVVIGAWSPEAKAFLPCLTIGEIVRTDDNGQPSIRSTVTVHGDLVVNGTLYEMQKRALPQTTSEVQNILLQNALSNINTTIAPVVAGGQPNASDVDLLKRMLKTEGGRTLLVDTLVEDEQFASVIAKLFTKAPSPLIDQLLTASTDIIRSLITKVLASPTLPDFVAAIVANTKATPKLVEQLLLGKNETRLGEVLKAILAQSDKRTDVITALTAVKEDQRKAFIRSLLKNAKAQVSLIDDVEARSAAAALMAKAGDGQKATATALIDVWKKGEQKISELKSLIDTIQDGPKEFRAQLRKALEDPPAPPTG